MACSISLAPDSALCTRPIILCQYPLSLLDCGRFHIGVGIVLALVDPRQSHPVSVVLNGYVTLPPKVGIEIDLPQMSLVHVEFFVHDLQKCVVILDEVRKTSNGQSPSNS
jgi:hypothetical protein